MIRNRLGTLAVCVAMFAMVSPALSAQQRQYIAPRMANDTASLPFSEAVMVGNTLYLSGTIGLLPGNRVPDSAEEEARMVMENVKATLAQAGMTMDDLVSVQVFCSDLSQYRAFNRVYATYFTREYPARAFLGVAHVLFDARFEVQGIAVRRASS